MQQSTVWISYDLGVTGDYESLYSWLDTRQAKECGSSVAYLTYSHDTELMACLLQDIKDHVTLDKRSRIYVVRKDGDDIKGRYLVGRRRAAPWEGYGEIDDQEEDSA